MPVLTVTHHYWVYFLGTFTAHLHRPIFYRHPFANCLQTWQCFIFWEIRFL